jgi:hypothetical protein
METIFENQGMSKINSVFDVQFAPNSFKKFVDFGCPKIDP